MVRLPTGFSEHKKPQIFENLGESSLEKILSHSVLQRYETGRLLIQQGDTPSHVYLVIEGSLRTFRIDEEGKEATIRMLHPGDTCMDAVVFMNSPSPINVQMSSDSQLLMIPERVIRAHVLEDAQFATNILRIVSRHYKNAMHQIEAMNIKSPLQRVGYYFLMRSLEEGKDNLTFKIPFQKQTIANYLGMTPETFSRTLKQLRELGVNVEDETITLADAFRLCHFCDTDTVHLCPLNTHEKCRKCVRH